MPGVRSVFQFLSQMKEAPCFFSFGSLAYTYIFTAQTTSEPQFKTALFLTKGTCFKIKRLMKK